MTGSIDWMLVDRPLNTVSFESLSHTNTVLNGLNELRRREYLLDVTLLAEGQSFKVSKYYNCIENLRELIFGSLENGLHTDFGSKLLLALIHMLY